MPRRPVDHEMMIFRLVLALFYHPFSLMPALAAVAPRARAATRAWPCVRASSAPAQAFCAEQAASPKAASLKAASLKAASLKAASLKAASPKTMGRFHKESGPSKNSGCGGRI
jgi:hypothetical protein